MHTTIRQADILITIKYCETIHFREIIKQIVRIDLFELTSALFNSILLFKKMSLKRTTSKISIIENLLNR